MLIYWLELKKLLSAVAVWGFIAACLLFNLVIIISNSGDEYGDFVGAVAQVTGYILDQSFAEKLSRLTVGGKPAEYLAQLKHETEGVTDVFEGYETRYIGERYIQAMGATGYWADLMREKYAALQKVVEEKAKKDESLVGTVNCVFIQMVIIDVVCTNQRCFSCMFSQILMYLP